MIGEVMRYITPRPEKPSPVRVSVVGSLRQVNEPHALLFSRRAEDISGWRVLPVSLVRGISPTDLHRLLQEAIDYLHGNPGSAVVIDCLEYLVLYNGLKSVLKFLHDLRDHVILHGGRLYVITSSKAWSEREYALLRGVANV